MNLANLTNEVGLNIDLYHLKKLEDLVEIFLEKSRELNLTSIQKDQDILIKHIIDSLMLLKYIDFKEGETVLDLGTGGGFPGLPLAIMNPKVQFTLVDATKRKIETVQQFAEKLGLSNVTVLQARAESLGHEAEHREAYDCVLARALAPLRTLLEYALPLTKVFGGFIAYKGRNYTMEMIHAREAMDKLKINKPKIVHYDLPEEKGEHAYLIFYKEFSTPQEYPRRDGIPTKRPL